MFQHHLEARETLDDALQVPLDEPRSRSKTSTSGSVTSPCRSSGRPTSSMAANTASQRAKSVTPNEELVVAPTRKASPTACTKPLALARRISSGVVWSVR
jgi:hypothetical protein